MLILDILGRNLELPVKMKINDMEAKVQRWFKVGMENMTLLKDTTIASTF